MGNAIFILAVVLLAAFGLFMVPRFLMKRAVKQVIRIFRHHSATDAKSARTIDEIGLKPRSFVEGLMKTRDYKPHALQFLLSAEVLRTTEEGKVYLSEDALASSGIEERSRGIL